MPPRKRVKRAHSSTPQEDMVARSNADTPASNESAAKPGAEVEAEAAYDLLSDPWTDEQETALLKAIIKFKPVGLFKHIRMLAIVDYLTSQGFGPETAEHMRIPGIWQKLRTLYNLEALDERENAVLLEKNEDEDPEDEKYWPYEPPQEFRDLMFERRLAADGSSSPVTSRHAESRHGSTVADTDEPRSSPAPSGGRKSTRGTRKSTRGTRSTRLNVEIGSGSPGKGSDGDGESEEHTDGNDEDEDEEGDEGSDGAKDSEDDEEAEEEKGGSRSTRAQTSKSKQKDKKTPTSAGTRRTGRRR